MFCPKCGSTLKEEAKFCSNCGETITKKETTNNAGPSGKTITVTPPKKKAVWPIVLIIVLVVFLLFAVAIGFGVFWLVKSSNGTSTVTESTNYHLVCTADEGDITLDYNDDEIYGYDARDITYNLENQQKLFEQYGKDVYMDTFNEWFQSNTSGTCVVKDDSGKKIKEYPKNNSNKSNSSNSNTSSNTKIVGEDKYGYVEVPSNWGVFKDINGASAIQFSYGTTYIVSLDYIENSAATAKALASAYMARCQEDSNLSGVTGATVTIGKNKEYTAYQVYMYYLQEKTYLITYWFEADDGAVHYIALEGPEGVEDFLDIPESFSLTK